MPKRKTGCGFNRNKHVETPKNLTFKAIGSLDNICIITNFTYKT